MSEQQVELKILRQDSPDASPRWEHFKVPLVPYMNVLSCLTEIRKNPVDIHGKPVAPITWDAACLEEVCGSCTMLINGKVRQACSAMIKDLKQPIELRPMTKFPVLRDLQVDRTKIFNNFKRVEAWIEIDGTHDLGPGPRYSADLADLRYELSRCMACGCCLEVCPNFGPQSPFVGAATVNQARLFNTHPTGALKQSSRIDALMEEGGIQDCGNAQNCVSACPQEIPLTTSLAEIMKSATKRMLFGKD